MTPLRPLDPESPPILRHRLSPAERELLPRQLYAPERPDVLVSHLRGSRMETTKELMREIGAALQFGDVFGENWHALSDGLTELERWWDADHYLLAVSESEKVLAKEPGEVVWLLDVLSEAARWWAEPVRGTGSYATPPKIFRTICQETISLDERPDWLADLPELEA